MIREKLTKRRTDRDDDSILNWQIPCNVELVGQQKHVVIQQGCELRAVVEAMRAREQPTREVT